jgi:hypothetical protein
MSDAIIHRALLSAKLSTAHFAFLFCIWLIVANPIGIAAAALALPISLRLWPRYPVNLRPAPFAKLTLRLLSCSILARVDVARRALLPRLDLRPGFVTALSPCNLAERPVASFSCIKAFSLEPRLLVSKAIISSFTAWTSASRLLMPSRQTNAHDGYGSPWSPDQPYSSSPASRASSWPDASSPAAPIRHHDTLTLGTWTLPETVCNGRLIVASYNVDHRIIAGLF